MPARGSLFWEMTAQATPRSTGSKTRSNHGTTGRRSTGSTSSCRLWSPCSLPSSLPHSSRDFPTISRRCLSRLTFAVPLVVFSLLLRCCIAFRLGKHHPSVYRDNMHKLTRTSSGIRSSTLAKTFALMFARDSMPSTRSVKTKPALEACRS